MNNSKTAKEIWEDVMNTVPDDNIELGKYFTYQVKHNLKHLFFTLARYKFASKMIGSDREGGVLELGCSEGVGSLMLSQECGQVLGLDFDEESLKWAIENLSSEQLQFKSGDFLNKKYGDFSAVVSLDVIEHIKPEEEDAYIVTVTKNLREDGIAIIGTPNITASQYASKASEIGHINLYDHKRLKESFSKYFNNVMMFGMNDEMVHTGFLPMAHYLMVVATYKK